MEYGRWNASVVLSFSHQRTLVNKAMHLPQPSRTKIRQREESLVESTCNNTYQNSDVTPQKKCVESYLTVM